MILILFFVCLFFIYLFLFCLKREVGRTQYGWNVENKKRLVRQASGACTGVQEMLKIRIFIPKSKGRL